MKKYQYHAPETPYIDSRTPPKTKNNLGCTQSVGLYNAAQVSPLGVSCRMFSLEDLPTVSMVSTNHALDPR